MRIEVEESALESIKAMARKLQEERDEALRHLSWATRTMQENKFRIGYDMGSPMQKSLKRASDFIDRCNSSPKVME